MSGLLKMALVLSLVDRFTSPARGAGNALGSIGKNAEALTGKLSKLSEKMEKMSQGLQGIQSIGQKLTLGGLASGAGIAKSMEQFADLEEAQKFLRTTMMDKAGRVGSEYDRLNSLAERLGTDLPGSTKDMIQMFIALREQGVQTQYILGGTGEAAAKFATLMKLGFADSATHTAKFSESMGVADRDMVKFMDLLQRLKFASGVEVGDLAYTFKYAGGSLKLLGLQGLDAARDFSAIVGVLAAAGIEGSTAGTNMSQALGRMAEIGHKLETKKIKELVGPILDRYGVQLNFFDNGGQFKGLRAMVAELEKLKRLNPQEQIITLKKLFGDEAARPLAVLLKSGVSGYDSMLQRMQKQADMEIKIREIMSGTKMQWETMTGTAANFVAHVGGVFAKLINLPGILGKLNNLFGRLDSFVLAHPKIAGILGGVVITLASLAFIGGGLLTMFAGIGLALPNAIAGFTLLMSVGSKLGYVVRGVRFAFWLLGQAITWNPATLPLVAAIAGIGAALYQLRKHWQVLSGPGFWKDLGGWLMSVPAAFFRAGANIATSLWQGIKAMASKPVDAMKAIAAKIRALLPFSPAKEGPLRDIHRIRLIETIAEAMKPRPMVNAMRTAVGAVAAVGMMGGAGSAGAVTIHYNPQVTIQGMAGAGVQNDIMTALRQHQDELLRLVEQAQAKANRGKF